MFTSSSSYFLRTFTVDCFLLRTAYIITIFFVHRFCKHLQIITNTCHCYWFTLDQTSFLSLSSSCHGLSGENLQLIHYTQEIHYFKRKHMFFFVMKIMWVSANVSYGFIGVYHNFTTGTRLHDPLQENQDKVELNSVQLMMNVSPETADNGARCSW